MLLVFFYWYLKYWVWPMKDVKAWNLSRQFILAVSDGGAWTKDLRLKESSDWQCSIDIALQFFHCPCFYLTEFIDGIRRACRGFVDIGFFSYTHTEHCMLSAVLDWPSYWICRKFLQIENFLCIFAHIHSLSYIYYANKVKDLSFSPGSCKNSFCLVHRCELQRDHYGGMEPQLRFMLITTGIEIHT